MNEDFTPFELAVKLKEKGFNWRIGYAYGNEDKDWGETNSTNWVTSDYDTVGEFITAFRQAMEGGAE